MLSHRTNKIKHELFNIDIYRIFTPFSAQNSKITDIVTELEQANTHKYINEKLLSYIGVHVVRKWRNEIWLMELSMLFFGTSDICIRLFLNNNSESRFLLLYEKREFLITDLKFWNIFFLQTLRSPLIPSVIQRSVWVLSKLESLKISLKSRKRKSWGNFKCCFRTHTYVLYLHLSFVPLVTRHPL